MQLRQRRKPTKTIQDPKQIDLAGWLEKTQSADLNAVQTVVALRREEVN